MPAQPRALIVFFSRSGTTREIAHEISRALELRGVRCDLEQLRDHARRGGVLGYLRSGFDATRDRPAKLAPLGHDPTDYDVVVIGTPVWAATPSTPIRTFLRANAAHLDRVAFFLTHGGTGRTRTFGQLRLLAQRAPCAELAVREAELAKARHHKAVRAFADEVTANVSTPRPERARARERSLPWQ